MNHEQLLKKHDFKQEKANANYLDEPDLAFPQSIKRYKLVLESYGMSIEEPYFWILNMLREGMQYVDIIKLKDVFTATETSSFFGLTGTRLERQQTLAMQYLAQIGKFIKELFGMIRELKTIDLRLEMYTESNKKFRNNEKDKIENKNLNRSESQSAEIALKNLWIELVEGGAKNSNSVFGLAQQVGFGTLPDLFFSNPAKSTEDLDKEMNKLPYNEKVKNVLKSKLYSYFSWKEKSYYEYVNRRKFMIKYLRQHYEIIRTYMNWVRPYLTQAKRLSSDLERIKSPDLVGAFEQSMIEVEFLAKKKGAPHNRCILVHFLYKTRPALEFHKENYQHKGAIHVGRVEVSFRGYTWKNEEIDAFKKLREDEDFELLGSVDTSISAAMEVLKDDLKAYLKEAGLETFKEDEKTAKEKEEDKPKPPRQSLFEPFTELAKATISPLKMMGEGFAEMVGIDLSRKVEKAKPKKEVDAEKTDKSKAEKDVQMTLYQLFSLYKKSHGMTSF